MRKEKIINECVRKSYLPPDICCVSLTDGHPLMETSIGRFEDMEYGGDLGGDSSGSGSGGNGSFNDMEWGGDLGGDVTGGSGSKATTFGGMLWNKEFEELAKYVKF